MSEIVDRVARAMYDTMPVGVREWPDAPEYTRLRCITCARAAIEAMREPSETMERAGADVLDGSYVGACAVWGKMIDAALAP